MHQCESLWESLTWECLTITAAAHNSVCRLLQVQGLVNEMLIIGGSVRFVEGTKTGAAVSVMALTWDCFIFWRFTVSRQCTLDICVLFDKLPFMCFQADAACVSITVFLSLLCVMSEECFQEERRFSLVTSSYLFYLIMFQMTNKTWLPVGQQADWHTGGRPVFHLTVAHWGNASTAVVEM